MLVLHQSSIKSQTQLMKNIILLFLTAFISICSFSQSGADNKALHFTDSSISSFQYFENDSIGKKFITVEKAAEFRGGSTAWIKYLRLNLDGSALAGKYVKIPKGQKSAKQQANVEFIVDPSGVPTEIRVINRDEVHPKIAAEAIRIIQESPRWIPGQREVFVDEDLTAIEEQIKDKVSKKMSLKKAKSYIMQPIIFMVKQE